MREITISLSKIVAARVRQEVKERIPRGRVSLAGRELRLPRRLARNRPRDLGLAGGVIRRNADRPTRPARLERPEHPLRRLHLDRTADGATAVLLVYAETVDSPPVVPLDGDAAGSASPGVTVAEVSGSTPRSVAFVGASGPGAAVGEGVDGAGWARLWCTRPPAGRGRVDRAHARRRRARPLSRGPHGRASS